ncbi:hypothetical protein Trydic_g17976 [Trypoxylus dichotomus]
MHILINIHSLPYTYILSKSPPWEVVLLISLPLLKESPEKKKKILAYFATFRSEDQTVPQSCQVYPFTQRNPASRDMKPEIVKASLSPRPHNGHAYCRLTASAIREGILWERLWVCHYSARAWGARWSLCRVEKASPPKVGQLFSA